MKLHALCAFALAGGLAACANDEAAGPRGLKVAVAPLDYPGIFDVCYGLTVYNGDPGGTQAAERAVGGTTAPDVVWSEAGICSQTYGSLGGGDITYIGTCDADSGDDNYVDLVLESIETENDGFLDDQNTAFDVGGDGDPDFQNPCPDGEPCTLHFPCVENTDQLVEFNLTILRDAEQGFFDVAVNFDDIFCSTKFDNCNTDGEFIELLFGDASGETIPGVNGATGTPLVDGPGRDQTAVFAMACTAGPGVDIDTEILYSKVHIQCGDKGFNLPLTDLEQGNNAVYGDVDGDGLAKHQVQYGLYYGTEQLNCDDPETEGTIESCNKKFYNIAINLEDLPAQGCTLSLQATAQDAENPVIDGSGVIGKTGTSYPYITLKGGELTQTDCFHYAPDGNVDGNPLTIDYGTSKDLAGGTSVAVMCNGSTGGAAYALPDTGKNIVGEYNTKERAFATTLSNLAVYEGFGKKLNDPCTGLPGSGRELVRYQKADFGGTINSDIISISGFSSPADANLTKQLEAYTKFYIGGAKGNASVVFKELTWADVSKGGNFEIGGLSGATIGYSGITVDSKVTINGYDAGFALRYNVAWGITPNVP